MMQLILLLCVIYLVTFKDFEFLKVFCYVDKKCFLCKKFKNISLFSCSNNDLKKSKIVGRYFFHTCLNWVSLTHSNYLCL